MAESEFADHQISRTAELTSADDGTLSNVRCWPAKLASAPSSSTADERTASGACNGWTDFKTRSMARSSPEATASTIAPESATPGGTESPFLSASPNPTALEPKIAVSVAFERGTTSFTPALPLRRRFRRPVPASRRQCVPSHHGSRPRLGCRTHAQRSPNGRGGRRCRSRWLRGAARGC